MAFWLIGVLAADQLSDLLLLGPGQLGVPGPPAAPPHIQRPIAPATMRCHPVADRLPRDAQQARDLDLRATLTDQADRRAAQLSLRVRRKRASIPDLRQPYTTCALFTTPE